MKLIAVLSPLRGRTPDERLDNELRAEAICRDIALDGDCPMATHLLFSRFLNDDDPAERAAGIACGQALQAMCDEVRAYPRGDGALTEGMMQDIRAAWRRGQGVEVHVNGTVEWLPPEGTS